MKNSLLILFCITLISFFSCKKDSPAPTTPAVTEQEVLTDFAEDLANPNYADLQTKANLLNEAIINLNASTTDANLAAAQVAWRNARTVWESAEGYLFGPVEDFNYDPSIDTWPVDAVELDSLLSSSNPLGVTNIDSLPFALKGFHAIEYIIFGVGESRTAAQLTARQLQFVVSLSQSVYNTTTDLVNSWAPDDGNFTAQLTNAGNGSAYFTSRKAAFLGLTGAMSDICNEVANEKMEDPLIAHDSTLDESSFSHNTTTDFKNNITGVLNAYLCEYNGTGGHSLSELVAAKNISLDNTIKSEINAAVNSFNSITTTYEKAIYTQQVQIHNTQTAINTLKETLDSDLTTFIQTNITD
jgi:putative iron-regulated protein